MELECQLQVLELDCQLKVVAEARRASIQILQHPGQGYSEGAEDRWVQVMCPLQVVADCPWTDSGALQRVALGALPPAGERSMAKPFQE